ncbi:MAG: acyltransferase [Chitinophagales bacterium]
MNRIKEFDYIRVFAAFSVIILHVTSSYIQFSATAYLLNQIVRYSVPMFIILSGYLLYQVDSTGPVLLYTEFLRKRLSKVFGPYIIWTTVYFIFTLVVNTPQNEDFTIYLVLCEWLHHIAWGTGYVHLYFLIIIIQFYLLYPFLRNWVEKQPNAALFISLFITVASQTLLYLQQLQLLTLPATGDNPLYSRLFTVWIFYFVFGIYLSRRKTEVKDQRTRQLFLALFWFVSLVFLLADNRITGAFPTSMKPTIVLYTVTSYFFFYYLAGLATQNNQNIDRGLTWFSRQSFLIYLSHPLFMGLAVRLVPFLGLPRIWYGSIGMFALLLVVSVSATVFSYIISLTPIASLVGGMPRKDKHSHRMLHSG